MCANFTPIELGNKWNKVLFQYGATFWLSYLFKRLTFLGNSIPCSRLLYQFWFYIILFRLTRIVDNVKSVNIGLTFETTIKALRTCVDI